MKELGIEMFGNISIYSFIAFTFWGFLGVLLNIIVELFKRKPNSPTSPYKFSTKYWFKDNMERIIPTLLLIPVISLLGDKLVSIQLDNGYMFIIGYSADVVFEVLKRKRQLI